MKNTSTIDLEEFVDSLNHSEKIKLSAIVRNYFTRVSNHDESDSNKIVSLSEFISNNPGIA